MISSLAKISLEEIHNAFIDAFSEYEVKIDMPKDKLSEMLITRSYSQEHSLGYFNEGILSGFLLVGYREINGQKIFYDVATGIRKKYQGKKIGDKLVKEIRKLMIKNNIDKFVLEVLEHNVTAQRLYKKNGFEIVRKLNCYEYSGKKSNLITDKSKNMFNESYPIINISVNEYCTFTPSWQNSYISYLNMREKYYYVSEIEKNELAGFGIVHKINGSLLQIGLSPKNRSIKVLQKIIEKLYQNTESDVMKYLNVEENSIMETLIKKIGFKNIVNQFEMEYKNN